MDFLDCLLDEIRYGGSYWVGVVTDGYRSRGWDRMIVKRMFHR